MKDWKQDKLHVLQITGAMNRGGAEVMLMDIYRNISSATRFDFLINVKRNDHRPQGAFDEEILKRGGRLFYIGTQWELGVVKYIYDLKKLFRRIGTPDVVHIHMNAKCGVIAMAAKLCGVKKIIAHSHAALKFKGPLPKILPSILELKLQRLLISLFATDFWGCSREANESLYYRRLIDQGRTLVIKNAVDVEAFGNVTEEKVRELRNLYSVEKDALIIGNVGRVVRHKKVDFVLDILKILHERNIDFLFVFAGRDDDKAYLEEIRTKMKQHSIEDKILYLGDRGDIQNLMSTFDVFVGPAVNEGFGLVAAEAQAAGLPCVLSTGFPPDVDMKLNLVTYLDAYQPRLWADAVLNARGKKCSDRARIQTEFAERGFDAGANARRVEELYHGLESDGRKVTERQNLQQRDVR